MPNICDFNMRVLGRAQDVDFFVEELNQDYCYDANGMCKEVSGNKRHFCRVFEAHGQLLVVCAAENTVIIAN